MPPSDPCKYKLAVWKACRARLIWLSCMPGFVQYYKAK